MDNSYFNWKQKEQQVDLGPFTPPENVPPFVRTKETGDKVYLVKDGYAHWITSPEVLQAVGGDFGKIETIDRSIFRQLRITNKITMENVHTFMQPEESIVKDPETGKEETIVATPGKIHLTQDEFYDNSNSEKLKAASEALTEERIALVEKTENEFKQYDEPEVPSAPQAEPIKGLTSIIIPVYWVHYPSFHYTGNCIGSIREHTDKEKTPYEIILVINGNTGITIDKLSDTYADKVIQNEENEGFAKAVNKGIRCASGEYIAIVNNDVQVYGHWLEDMQEALTKLDLVMATPMYGMPFARAVEAKELRDKSNPTPDDDPQSNIHETFSDFKDFSCVLTRKKMFDQIGLFDEQFFMYGEDLDLMRRMEKEGLKLASTKRVNTTHIIGATSSGINEMPEIMNESKAKLKEKWGY